MKNFRPPTSPGLSLVAANARNGEGIGGIYVKTEAHILVRPSDGIGAQSFIGLPSIATATDKAGVLITTRLNAFSGLTLNRGIFLNSEIQCPSSRVRVSFGVNSVRAGDSSAYFFDATADRYAYFNVIPGIKHEKIIPAYVAVNDFGGDATNVISGQPVFPYASVSSINPLIFDPSDYFIGGYDGSAAHSGGVVTSNNFGFPFSFEDESNATVYRLRGGIFAGDATAFVGPIYVWARWEIIDPRSKEDSEALLTECRLIPAPMQKFNVLGVPSS